MSMIRDEALTLRRVDYSETSQVLVCLTRAHGKIRVIAKGSKRSTKTRFSPGIDLLERGEIVYSQREGREAALGTLTEWKQRQPHSGLRSSLERLHAAEYLAEVTPALVEEGDPHPDLFAAAAETLEQLSAGGEAIPLTGRYQLALVEEVGVMPMVDRCALCGGALAGSGEVYFSSQGGGLMCRDCEPAQIEKRLVNREAMAWIRGEADSLRGAAGAFDVLNYHISHLLGREPKLAAMVLPARRRKDIFKPQ